MAQAGIFAPLGLQCAPMNRMLFGLVAAVVAASALAGAASGALFLRFSPTRADAGEVVIAHTAGKGALANIPKGSPPLRVFLVPASEADRIASPSDGRLLALGRLQVDPSGDGSLRFTVPDVAPGSYTTLTYCAPCAAFSGGRTMAPTGPFPGSFVVTRERGGDFPLWAVLLAATAVLVGAGVVGWRARTRGLARAS
jgi:hypothetical protein